MTLLGIITLDGWGLLTYYTGEKLGIFYIFLNELCVTLTFFYFWFLTLGVMVDSLIYKESQKDELKLKDEQIAQCDDLENYDAFDIMTRSSNKADSSKIGKYNIIDVLNLLVFWMCCLGFVLSYYQDNLSKICVKWGIAFDILFDVVNTLHALYLFLF